jgi:hypothetical protein
MAIGLGWLVLQRTRHPKMIAQMQSALESVHLRFAHVREHALNPMSTERESSPPARYAS